MAGPADLLRNKLDHLKFRIICSRFRPADTLMDIGCGNRPQTVIRVRKRHYAIDPMVTPDRPEPSPVVRLKGDWKDALQRARENPPDCLTLMDVIEHLPKEEGRALLRETELLVNRIIVFTPLGFLAQEDGEWNTHRSGWQPEDFGDNWTVHVFPHFHWCDFRGTVFDRPRGALLAVFDKNA